MRTRLKRQERERTCLQLSEFERSRVQTFSQACIRLRWEELCFISSLGGEVKRKSRDCKSEEKLMREEEKTWSLLSYFLWTFIRTSSCFPFFSSFPILPVSFFLFLSFLFHHFFFLPSVYWWRPGSIISTPVSFSRSILSVVLLSIQTFTLSIIVYYVCDAGKTTSLSLLDVTCREEKLEGAILSSSLRNVFLSLLLTYLTLCLTVSLFLCFFLYFSLPCCCCKEGERVNESMDWMGVHTITIVCHHYHQGPVSSVG